MPDCERCGGWGGYFVGAEHVECRRCEATGDVAEDQEEDVMLHADFDGIHATIRAGAHADEPGKVVIAIGGPLGGSIIIDADQTPQLVRELGTAHVRALQLRAEHGQATAVYSHA